MATPRAGYDRLVRRMRVMIDIGRKGRPPADAADAPPPGGAPGVDRSDGLAELRVGMDKIRESLKAYGSAVAALATAVLTGLGYGTLHNLYPVPADHRWVGPLALVLAAAVVGSTLWLVSRFFSAQRRIVFMPSRISPPARNCRGYTDGLARNERSLVEDVLREHAGEELAGSARALEMRALRLARIARRLEPAASAHQPPGPIQREAERLDAVLAIATRRASLALLEHRAQKVFSSWRLAFVLACAAGSVVGLILLADYSKGERDLIDLRKKCSDAVAAGAQDACAAVAPKGAGNPTPTPSATPPPVPPPLLDIIQRLNACVHELGPAAVPTPVIERSLVACAQLPAPAQTAARPLPTPT